MTKNKLRPFAILAIGLLWAGFTQAQESTNTSGGDATGSGGSVAYSVGQAVYTSTTSSTGSVTQGVQHSYLISNIDIKEITLNISLNVYPNPTTNDLTLQISDYKTEKLSYQLFDTQGKLLNNGPIESQQTQIDMKSLPTATYFVNVINSENKKIQSFKIIKTQ